MQRNIFLILLVAIMLMVGQTPGYAASDGFSEQYVRVRDGLSYVQTDNHIQGAGNFFIRRIVSDLDYMYFTSFRLPGSEGSLVYFDDENNMVSRPLSEGSLPQGRILHLKTDSYNYILGQPYTYRYLGDGTKDSVGTIPINLKRDQDGWIVEFRYQLHYGVNGILWGMGSPNQLVNFDDPNQLRLWSVYDTDRNARILYDGYHYRSPSTYRPSTGSSFWRIPSDYLANSLVSTGGSLASEIMGQSMLRIAHRNINSQGFLPTLPRSNWLYGDYGIDSGFFDTRFNADTIVTNIQAHKRFGGDQFRNAYLKLAEYYLEHGARNHYTVFDPALGEGWLVEDYYGPGGGKNHVALNHQLQSINAFLKLYEVERDQRYLDFARKMLNGVKITRDMWIMDNGNLEYAYLPDGTMGLVDYEYLTYNDLLNVQEVLLRLDGNTDPDLDVLISSKKHWMDSNSVVGYRK